MSTQNINVVWQATTTAKHWAWVKAVSDALTAVGLTKTSDTGQTVLTGSTLVLPVSVPSGTAGFGSGALQYEIRQMASSGKPTIYMKIKYGIYNATGAAAGYWPYIEIQWGSATDGAGNLGGVVGPNSMASLDVSMSTAPPANPRPVFIASDGQNYLTFIVDPTVLYAPINCLFAACLERTITASTGAYNSVGWAKINLTSYYTAVYEIVNISGGITSSTTRVPQQTTDLFTSSGSGTAAYLFPVTVMTPAPQGPMLGAVGYYTTDIVVGSQFSATLYGSVRNYLAMGKNCYNSNYDNLHSSANFALALRYE